MKLLNGDCLDELKKLESNSVDSLITDPPAGIAFMGKDWDKDKGGRDEWIKWMTEVMEQCHRVMKPGAHGFVWAIPRTSHWTAMASENAGFEVRDVVIHLFGSGFPKSHNISKAIDKKFGAERKVLGIDKTRYSKLKNQIGGHIHPNGWKVPSIKTHLITEPATDAAKQWDGWGTALKPASEHWILVRKPFKGTVADNVLKHGTGGINIDASRISTEGQKILYPIDRSARSGFFNLLEIKEWIKEGKTKDPNGENLHYLLARLSDDRYIKAKREGAKKIRDFGRFPSNVILDEEAGKLLDEQSGVLKSGARTGQPRKNKIFLGEKELSGGYCEASSGGASRFFYCAKASRRERGKDNTHPTVKAQKLMQYLIRMITPPGGSVLDPFMGSGSTGVASAKLNFDFIGIEKETEYFEIATARITNVIENRII